MNLRFPDRPARDLRGAVPLGRESQSRRESAAAHAAILYLHTELLVLGLHVTKVLLLLVLTDLLLLVRHY